ncbi:hypothetical protein ACFVT1_07575 [Streptomyces sp. NPDC057963]|uniref:hypothetical protein n=1 Tax=Streptomyces sp. NPDC057963 TaxID=3346290 RepID=UPI0036E2F4AB
MRAQYQASAPKLSLTHGDIFATCCESVYAGLLHETEATSGGPRRICDLFGLSVGAALRYTGTIDQSPPESNASPGSVHPLLEIRGVPLSGFGCGDSEVGRDLFPGAAAFHFVADGRGQGLLRHFDELLGLADPTRDSGVCVVAGPHEPSGAVSHVLGVIGERKTGEP